MIQKIKKLISSFFIQTELISPNTKDLHDQVIIITGASRGIGKSIADVLNREGAKLVLISRDKKDLEEVFHTQQNENLLFVEADITQEKDIKKIIDATLGTFGSIDVLINNAGRFLDKQLEDITEQEFQSIIDVNVKGMFFMSKAVIPHMKKKKNGLIINIGSKISHNTNVTPKKVMYATTKYAVEGFSLSLSKELKQFGIRVTCLMPGTVSTFVSLKSKEFLPPFYIGFVISMIIKCKEIDFESIILKSKLQNL